MSPPVPSNRTSLESAWAVSRAVLSSAVNRRRSRNQAQLLRGVAELTQLAVHLVDGRAKIALKAGDPPAQFLGHPRDVLRVEAPLPARAPPQSPAPASPEECRRDAGSAQGSWRSREARSGARALPTRRRAPRRFPRHRRERAERCRPKLGGPAWAPPRSRPRPASEVAVQCRRDVAGPRRSARARPRRAIRGRATARPRSRAPDRRSPAA